MGLTTMILEIQHETRLEYAEPVTESVTEVRMEPTSEGRQSCRSFHLRVNPAVPIHRYLDGFGNRVHHFNVLATHSQVLILAASIIETPRHTSDLGEIRAAFPLNPEAVALEAIAFLGFRGPVCRTPLLDPLLEKLRPEPGSSLAEFLLSVSAYIKCHFTYAPAVTHASSPVDDVLRQGKGVCQDFAHLMIAVLRAFELPARYVSGYIHRPGMDSQSHAWCEAWLPGLGWVGIDPTHDRIVDESHVKVAVGRDFTDVPPNKGIYRGQAQETMSVRVATRALELLPSLSWQEQLPPLHGPLTAVISLPREFPPNGADAQQQ
jgi:transglutaminase-like putative cysteine protease